MKTFNVACSSACSDLSNGVLKSIDNPVHVTKTLGILSVADLPGPARLLIVRKERGSQIEFPLAAWVGLDPPFGKDEPSGSAAVSLSPLNAVLTLPSLLKSKMISCFSAKTPESGWNTCVKCVQSVDQKLVNCLKSII